MPLQIDTFFNPRFGGEARRAGPVGGQTLFKAVGHPLAAEAAPALKARLAAARRLGIYDPYGQADCFDQLYGLADLQVAGVYVQRLEDLQHRVLGCMPEAADAIAGAGLDLLLVACFDAAVPLRDLEPIRPAGLPVVSFDALRLPEPLLTDRADYLAPANFATNFGFLRDAGGEHTAIVLPGYWRGEAERPAAVWLRLFDSAGGVLATWSEALPPAGGTLTIDSAAVRRRFGLGDFCGSLFIHCSGRAGHDIVKYAFDTYGEDGRTLSCSHDANAWPADRYAGLPAPDAGERVVLWVQNSHPVPIPAGAVGLNPMGCDEVRHWPVEVPAFGTAALDVASLFPDVAWPRQFEVRAGKYFVRPRYEIRHGNGRARIAHANVERTDLQANPEIPRLAPFMGLGYMLPIAVPPLAAFATAILPTPMSTAQLELPIAARLKDADGSLVGERYLGRVRRDAAALLEVDAWLAETRAALPSGSGHVELVYDFRDGGEADGWLHAIARYTQRGSGHRAETSFGAHVFNLAATYRDEPQSYRGRPPGLTTRLFLRLGRPPADTLCHLIYPASKAWRPSSSTDLQLFDAAGRAVAGRRVRIPCGGSLHWRASAMFDDGERAAAGEGAWVQVRDATCRLFGYHGLLLGDDAFSLDHMFGF